MKRTQVLSLAATLALASTAAAQQAGTFEVGLFPNVAYFDRTLRLDQGSAGPGARLGFFINRNWLIEPRPPIPPPTP